jgi:hypothetical protein
MRIAACVLTYNLFDTERKDLFEQTVDTLKSGGVELFVVDNGSVDGTAKLVDRATDWKPYLSTISNTTSGSGTWTCCRLLAGSEADICVVSDDDMCWKPGFADELEAWWSAAPGPLTITGGHLEPEFFWNEILARPTYGKVPGLVRTSTGAASWTFRKEHFARLALVAAGLPINRQGHWDVPMCNGLREQNWQIGQIDLATHAGQGRSSWGNQTANLYGWEPVTL